MRWILYEIYFWCLVLEALFWNITRGRREWKKRPLKDR